jgi:hypothetical protein
MRRAFAAALARRASAALLSSRNAPAPRAVAGAAVLTSGRAWQAAALSTSAPAPAPVHPADEPFCRQRSLVPLGPRVPTMSPDAWVAPNAVILGDVDLYDQVCMRACVCVCVRARLVGVGGGERERAARLTCVAARRFAHTGFPQHARLRSGASRPAGHRHNRRLQCTLAERGKCKRAI